LEQKSVATLLDNVLERHEGPEPRVVTTDVQKVLTAAIQPDNKDNGMSVTAVAEKAGVSTRTVYRVLNPKEARPTIALDLADRLCLACGVHIAFVCRLEWPDGRITPYIHHDLLDIC
jgi:DNA-binding phage protein